MTANNCRERAVPFLFNPCPSQTIETKHLNYMNHKITEVNLYVCMCAFVRYKLLVDEFACGFTRWSMCTNIGKGP